MSSSSTPTTMTESNTLDINSSSDATTDQEGSYSNTSPQEQTATETPVPESTTPEPSLTTTTDIEATTTQDQIEPTTQQAPTTTEASITTVKATRTTQDAQAYTEAPYYNDNDQPDDYSQPTTTDVIQHATMASNPTLTLTETSLAPVSPTIVVVTSTSGVSTVLSTSTCIPDSTTATTVNVCNSSNAPSAASQEANAAKMTVAQIAGIIVGVLGLFSLLVACILFKKRKHSSRLDNNKRRVSPFFYMKDQSPDPEKNLPFDTSTAALCQSYKNEQPPHTATATNSSVSDMSESVCGDNIFYSNSTDYHQSSTIMQPPQGIHEKLTTTPVITRPATGQLHHAVGYASVSSSPLRMDASVIDTPTTTLYPHMKRSDSSDLSKQTSSYNPFSIRQQQRTSTDIDTDNYTLSAMQLFQSNSKRNTATTTTTSRSMSPTIGSFSFVRGQQYRPSLHDSMYLGSQTSSTSCNNSSSDDSSTIQSLPVAAVAQSPRPPRFSRHHRQESSLDPHFYQQQQQQQQQPPPPHTMSLWDDHLN